MRGRASRPSLAAQRRSRFISNGEPRSLCDSGLSVLAERLKLKEGLRCVPMPAIWLVWLNLALPMAMWRRG